MTRWYPDTCGCVVDYDDNVKVTAVVRKCGKHSDTASDDHHLETVLAHNRKKNAVHNEIVRHVETLGLPNDGILTAYDHNDDLVVTGSGLKASDQKDALSKASPFLGRSTLTFKG